jgi:hypothetical protein
MNAGMGNHISALLATVHGRSCEDQAKHLLTFY